MEGAPDGATRFEDGGTSPDGGTVTRVEPDPRDLEPSPGCWNYATSGNQGEKPQGRQFFAQGFKGPIPTNRSWSSLAWDLRGDQPWSHNFYPHPLALRALSGGLGIKREPSVEITGDTRTYQQLIPYPDDLTDVHVGIEGLNAPETRVAGYSDWTVDAQWSDGSRTLTATIGSGMPFVYFRARGGSARVEVNRAFRSSAKVFYQEGAALGISVQGRPYALFAPPSAEWTRVEDGVFQSTLGGKDYFSVAALPSEDAKTLSSFHQHAYAFVTDTKVRWYYDESHSRVTTIYDVTTELLEPQFTDEPLIGLLPHHWRHSSDPLTDWKFQTPRGELRIAARKSFQTELVFGGVLPALPGIGAQVERLSSYLAEVNPAAPVPAPSYESGKAMGKLSHLMAIADQAKKPELRSSLADRVRKILEDWFRANDGGTGVFRYYDDWTTLIAYPTGYFADTQLNDHHFHWGYMIHAAALLSLYEPEWAKDDRYGGMIKMLVRDASSPIRGDSKFPFLRMIDVYEGHGWASGHANFAHGNNQESSSEAMNYHAALILWGEATGNRTIRDLGIYLYTTEASAIGEYWFNAHGDVFPKGYTHPVVGIVWGAGGAYATWWTAQPESIHGINFLPFHGGSLYLGRFQDYLPINYNHMVQQNGGPEGTGGGPDDWQDIIWLALGFGDPQGAFQKFEANKDNYRVEAGESKAHAYHYLATLNALGKIANDVTADIPTYAVLQKGGARTHVAFHAGCAGPRRVRFSDGVSFDVSPRTMVVRQDGGMTAIPLGTCTGSAIPACR